MENTRAKFKCESATTFEYGGIEYKFRAVSQDETPENQRFHQYTPNGTMAITVDNPDVNFKPGKSYYLDITEAPE